MTVHIRELVIRAEILQTPEHREDPAKMGHVGTEEGGEDCMGPRTYFNNENRIRRER